MTTTPSRIKRIIREQEFKSYDECVTYVFSHCGQRLRKGVIDYRHDLTRYIDAKNTAKAACGFQSANERTMLSKRGISGCSMTYETKLTD